MLCCSRQKLKPLQRHWGPFLSLFKGSDMARTVHSCCGSKTEKYVRNEGEKMEKKKKKFELWLKKHKLRTVRIKVELIMMLRDWTQRPRALGEKIASFEIKGSERQMRHWDAKREREKYCHGRWWSKKRLGERCVDNVWQGERWMPEIRGIWSAEDSDGEWGHLRQIAFSALLISDKWEKYRLQWTPNNIKRGKKSDLWELMQLWLYLFSF